MKTYKQLNRVMGDIRDAVHRAYDLGYTEGKNDSAEKITTLKRVANSFYGIKFYGITTTNIIPCPSPIGLQFKCQKCGETMPAQYPHCPWCGRIDERLVKHDQ